LEFHCSHGRLATVTTVHPTSNFGIVDIDPDGTVLQFREKPRMTEWINGGFFVFEHKALDLLDTDSVLEREPLETLAREGQLMAFQHAGFWKCMDTFKDSSELNQLWERSSPWKTW
jgi:glucose-1-phosphate cytidylyltransferase